MTTTWRLDVVCKKCGYVAATTPLGEGSTGDGWSFSIGASCPRCTLDLAGKPPNLIKRLHIYRAARRFRKELDGQA